MGATKQAELLPIDTVSPLAETVSCITALNAYRTYRMGIPDTEGWMRLSSFTDVEMLLSWFEAFLEQLGDRHAGAVALGFSSTGGIPSAAWLGARNSRVSARTRVDQRRSV